MVIQLVNKFLFLSSIFIFPTQHSNGAHAQLTNFQSVETSFYDKSLFNSAIHDVYRKKPLQVKTRTLSKINSVDFGVRTDVG